MTKSKPIKKKPASSSKKKVPMKKSKTPGNKKPLLGSKRPKPKRSYAESDHDNAVYEH